MPLSLHVSLRKINLDLFAMNRCNKMCVCVRLLEWLHWWNTFLCNLLKKRYVIFIISWHCSLEGNFLADTLRYLSWPTLSRSWHLAASGPVPLRLFSNVMTLHWHNVNVNKMSTLLKLRPTNAGDIVLTFSLGNRCIQTFHWTRLFSHTLLP